MINLDFDKGVAAYIILSLSAVFLVWLFGKKQKDKDLSLDPRFIWFCSVCSYTYVNTKEEFLSVCPRCGSYNKKND